MVTLARVLLLSSLLCPPSLSFQAFRLTTSQQRYTPSSNIRSQLEPGQGEANDPVLRLPLLEAELAILDQNASDSPNGKRSELESSIGDARAASEFGVRRAQVEFYDAFSSFDIDAMKKLWSDSDDVRCIHPAMAAIEGREAVMASWSSIFEVGQPFAIQPSRVKIDACGMTAVCSCVEETPNGGRLECLNIYRREEGQWRMTLHMAAPIIGGLG